MLIIAVLRAIALLVVTVSVLPAANFAFTGLFLNDSDSHYFTFSTSGGTTIRTLSYGGGTNVVGNLISPGGFDPLLNIFDMTGTQVGSADDSSGGNACLGGITSGTEGCLDSYFQGSLAPGTYILVVTQFDNVANGPTLSDGFTPGSACVASFCDGFDNTTARTGNWAVDILTADSASDISAAPEPGTIALAGFGVAAFTLIRRRSSYIRK